MTKDALYGEQWLLSYEGGRRRWVVPSDAHIRAEPRFNELLRRGVSFYDDAATLEPLFSLRPEVVEELNLQTDSELFDRTDDVSKYLVFEEPGSEYQDAADPSEFEPLT